MSSYDAIVYDLDGTLVRLDVEWDRARTDVAAKLRPRGIPTADKTLWELFELGVENGYWPLVHDTLAEHERKGARTSERLPLADDLPRDVPVGVCSLNAESACRIALEIHGIDGYIDVIAGRDTVDSFKPDPESLLATIHALDATPAQTLFIGDSDRDEQTATRAGVPFQYATQR